LWCAMEPRLLSWYLRSTFQLLDPGSPD
jgi:hypothetical protein